MSKLLMVIKPDTFDKKRSTAVAVIYSPPSSIPHGLSHLYFLSLPIPQKSFRGHRNDRTSLGHRVGFSMVEHPRIANHLESVMREMRLSPASLDHNSF